MSEANVEVVRFGTTDYVMLGIMLVVSMAIGMFFAVSGNQQKTKIDYLLGSRRLGAIPVCLSLFATFQSAIALLGTPAEIYTYGTMYAYITIAMCAAYGVGAVTLIPLIYPLKITSIYEYLELRYDSLAVRRFGTLIGILSS
ncbi:sodium-coupled monocarboxylate transporter 1-like, partial [Aplysia californica]|uniref:Sodium-coupled monocarboxylate transporter 1-like n=1 Tax=Aplysia californica TaxID=6500 RepID=A0ABM1VWA2_APLCA